MLRAKVGKGLKGQCYEGPIFMDVELAKYDIRQKVGLEERNQMLKLQAINYN